MANNRIPVAHWDFLISASRRRAAPRRAALVGLAMTTASRIETGLFTFNNLLLVSYLSHYLCVVAGGNIKEENRSWLIGWTLEMCNVFLECQWKLKRSTKWLWEGYYWKGNGGNLIGVMEVVKVFEVLPFPTTFMLNALLWKQFKVQLIKNSEFQNLKDSVSHFIFFINCINYPLFRFKRLAFLRLVDFCRTRWMKIHLFDVLCLK